MLPICHAHTLSSTLTSHFLTHFDALDQSIAFTFLSESLNETSITFSEINRTAKALAVLLTQQYPDILGRPILLLYPQGIDFVIGFVACLYSGAVAVPAYPPRNRKQIDRLMLIANNAGATLAFTDAATLRHCSQKFSELSESLGLISTDGIDLSLASQFVMPDIHANSLAFLQYTSGSTSAPKGVMVSQSNLLSNVKYIQKSFGLTTETVSASWLPQFHDMGLIGGILEPLYTGHIAHLMTPAHFVKNPLKWLEIISKYRVNHTGGPNFGYDHCVEALKRLDTDISLDLSCWTSAYNGSEPIHMGTLDRFTESFSRFGFSGSAHCPSYGLAEATLMVTAKPFFEDPMATTLDLGNGQVYKNVVSSGIFYDEMTVKIVNPDTLTVCAPNTIGEIWLSGTSVAMGYLNDPEKTKETFHAFTSTGAGPYMRTGDLGFFNHNQHLHVTGRIKEVVIVNGKNYFPHDIERVCEDSGDAFYCHGVVAFSFTSGAAEQVGIVAELKRSHLHLADFSPIVRLIKAAIQDEFGISLGRLILIKPASMPKTSSGKLKRSFIKEQCLSGQIESVFVWSSEDKSTEHFDILDIFNSIFTQAMTSANAPIQWDSFSSMQFVEFLTTLDIRFSISISLDDLLRAHCVADIEALVSKEQSRKLSQADPALLNRVFFELGIKPLTSITSYEGSYVK